MVIPLFVLLHFVNITAKKGKAIKFSNFNLAQNLPGQISRNYTKLAIRTLILVLLILAAAGAVYEYIAVTSAFNFVLVIDNSISMSASDLTPTRLEAAKESASNFIQSMPAGTKIGLVSFSGNSIIEKSLTQDKSQLLESISSLGISSVGGTNIVNAIATSTNMLISEPRSRVIILLTDGRSNLGPPIENALEFANNNQIIIYAIGIGTNQGAIIPELDTVSTLDEVSLRNLARSTGGDFFLVQDKELLDQAYTTIAGITSGRVAYPLTSLLLALSALLLIIKWVLEYFEYGTIP